ncbi:MAG: hypothetical protein RBT41_10905 [Clostridia bacterium]|jgi:flagellar motility protein MotE (MotC chaperone)|nr:hypothetical protein [Clostridia bacterium]
MKSNFIIIVVIISLIVVLIAGITAADKMGVIDIKAQFSQAFAHVPIIGEMLGEEEAEPPAVPGISPLEKENRQLNLQLTDAQKRITALEEEKTVSLKMIEELQRELVELRKYKENREQLLLETKELAVYYQEMKPQAVVKIMANLDDETIMMILPLLDTGQVANILSLMDPQRAALMTRLLLGNNPAPEE